MSALTNLVARITGRQMLPTDAETMIASLLPTIGRNPPERGVTGMLDAYSASPWLRAITSKVSRSVGSTVWQLYATKSASTGRFVGVSELQEKGIERRALRRKEIDVPEGVELVPVIDHPMLRLLNVGAGGFPGALGRTLTQLYLELTGEAFWMLEVKGGVPVGYWIIPPTWVQETPTPNGTTFYLESNGVSLEVPREFMLWFLDPNPRQPYLRGTGQMRTLGDEIDTDDYASKFTRSFFYNNAQPNVLITAPGLSKEDTHRFEWSWGQKLRGFANAHKPFFLNRDIKVTQLTQKFSEMQLIDLRKFERDMLINTRGIPPEVFGVIENSNRATIDAADYLFAKHVTVPALEFMRTFLQSELLPRYDDRLILGYDSPVEEDKEYHLQAATAAPWALTLNEWRRLAGQDAVDYGEVHVFKLAEEARPPEMIGTFQVEGQPEEPEVIEESGEGSRLLASGDVEKTKVIPCSCGEDHEVPSPDLVLGGEPFQKQLGGQGMAELAEKLGPRMAEELIIAFNELRNSIDMNALIAALEAGDIQAAQYVLALAEIDEALEPARQTLREALIVVGEASAAEVAQALGVDFAFEMASAAALQELETFGADMVTNITEGQRRAINTVLKEGYASGVTPKKMAYQIRDSIGLTEPQIRQMYKLYPKWVEEFGEEIADEKLAAWATKKIKDRADTITLNELFFAANRGQEMVWEFALGEGLLDPNRTLRQWKTNPNACEICQPLHNQKAKIGQPYPSGHHTPGEPHVSCRCYEVLIFAPP